MSPYLLKYPVLRKLFAKRQSELFGSVFTDFGNNMKLHYFMSQADDTWPNCIEYSYQPNEPMHGRAGNYVFNMNWSLSNLRYCVLWHYRWKRKPPTDRSIIVIFTEEPTSYDRYYRFEVATDRLPFAMYGLDMKYWFNKGWYHMIYVPRREVVDEWLSFAHRLQMTSRSVIDMESYSKERLSESIREILCSDLNKPTTDFFLYYLAHTYGNHVATPRDFVKYPIYFLWVVPNYLSSKTTTLMEDLEVYEAWQTVLSLLAYRYAGMKIGGILYDANAGANDKNCIATMDFQLISKVGPKFDNPFRTKRVGELHYTTAKYKAIVECIETLINKDKKKSLPAEQRFLYIVGVGDEDPFYLAHPHLMKCESNDKSCTHDDYIAEFLYIISKYHGHMLNVAANPLNFDYKKLDGRKYAFEVGHSHSYTKTPYYGFPGLVRNMIMQFDARIKTFASYIDSHNADLSKNMKLNGRKYKNLKIMLYFPKDLPGELVSGTMHLLGGLNQFEKLVQKRFGKQNIEFNVILYDESDKTPANKDTRCHVDYIPPVSEEKSKAILKEFWHHTKKNIGTGFPLDKLYGCTQSAEDWDIGGENDQLNIMAIVLVDDTTINQDSPITYLNKAPDPELIFLRRMMQATLYYDIQPIFIVVEDKLEDLKKKRISSNRIYAYNKTEEFFPSLAKFALEF